MFWWTIFLAAGCSLKHTDLFGLFTPTVGIILEHKGQEIMLSAVRQETEQGKAPTLEEQALGHPGYDILSMLHSQWLSVPKRNLKQAFCKRVDFAESNQTTLCLCLQKLPR